MAVNFTKHIFTLGPIVLIIQGNGGCGIVSRRDQCDCERSRLIFKAHSEHPHNVLNVCAQYKQLIHGRKKLKKYTRIGNQFIK